MLLQFYLLMDSNLVNPKLQFELMLELQKVITGTGYSVAQLYGPAASDLLGGGTGET